MKSFFKVIGILGKIRLGILAVACIFGYYLFVQYKDSKVYKNPKTVTMAELEAMPKNDIPKYFILTGAASTGDNVWYELKHTKKGRVTSTDNYIYYPIFSVGKNNKLNKSDSAQFFVCKKNGSAKKDLTEKMLDEDFEKIVAKYDGDKMESGVIDEFVKLKIHPAANHVVLERDSPVPSGEGKLKWIFVCAAVILLMVTSYVYDFKE